MYCPALKVVNDVPVPDTVLLSVDTLMVPMVSFVPPDPSIFTVAAAAEREIITEHILCRTSHG